MANRYPFEFQSAVGVANRLPYDIIERIGSRIYDDFRAGMIPFELCDACLETLTNITDGNVWLQIPGVRS